MKSARFLIPLFLFLLSACQPAQNSTLELARATENSVEVIISLTRAADGQVYLAATFAPVEKELHLYAKDTPKNGIDGIGRPSLLEIPFGSAIMVNGDLSENISAQGLSEMPDLAIYPAGAVTLRLPIILPAGSGWLDEQVSVTYMACTAYSCRPPVENKMIPIRIPENEAFSG